MSEKADTGICLETCVSHYEQYGNHDVYMEQIERCPSQRALLFELLKSYFWRAGKEREEDIDAVYAGMNIRKSNWIYGLNETGDRVTKMTWHNWRYGKSVPERSSLLQMAFYIGLNDKDTDRLLKTADYRGLYSRDFRDLILAFYLNQGWRKNRGAIPDREEVEGRMRCVRDKIRHFREIYLKEKALVYDASSDIYYYTGKLNGDIRVDSPVKNVSEEIYRASIEKSDMDEVDFEQFLLEHMKDLEIRRLGAIHIMQKYMSDRNCFFKYLEEEERYKILKKTGQYEYEKEIKGILRRILQIRGSSKYDYIMEGRKAYGRSDRDREKNSAEALYRAPETNIYTLVRFCFATGNEEPEKINWLLQRFGFRRISRCEGVYSRFDFFLNYLYRVADIDIIKAGKTDNGWLNMAVERHNYDYFHHPIFEQY